VTIRDFVPKERPITRALERIRLRLSDYKRLGFIVEIWLCKIKRLFSQ
jgi:hypothetical protein